MTAWACSTGSSLSSKARHTRSIMRAPVHDVGDPSTGVGDKQHRKKDVQDLLETHDMQCDALSLVVRGFGASGIYASRRAPVTGIPPARGPGPCVDTA